MQQRNIYFSDDHLINRICMSSNQASINSWIMRHSCTPLEFTYIIHRSRVIHHRYKPYSLYVARHPHAWSLSARERDAIQHFTVHTRRQMGMLAPFSRHYACTRTVAQESIPTVIESFYTYMMYYTKYREICLGLTWLWISWLYWSSLNRIWKWIHIKVTKYLRAYTNKS